MKKTLLPLTCMILGSTAFAQVENGDFENWNKLILFEQPFMGFDAVSSNYEFFIETGVVNVTEVEHEDGSAVRLENISVGDGVAPAFYLLGGTPDQNGEDLIFPGGLPASDPNVTGISVDMSYDFPGESSGFVIVQFKQNGVPVGPGTMGTGTFFFPISGQQDWENEIFDFGTTIDTPYNQVVIGFATADLIGSDSEFPAGSWMEIDNLSFVNSTDEIPNSDFELWAQVPPIFVPAKVDVKLDLLNLGFTRSTDAATGTFSLGLKTLDFDGFAEPTKASMGVSQDEDGVALIDLGEENSLLSFSYKYLAENDIAEVVITFYEEEGDQLLPVYGKVIDLVPNASFENIEYNFNEELDAEFYDPTKISIEFYSSKQSGEPQANSLLLVDDVQISGALSTFMSRIPTTPTVRAYPNPTLARVEFDFGELTSGFYTVLNNQGFQIELVNFKQQRKLVHNLDGLPAGQYTFKFFTKKGTSIVRVMKL